MLRLVLLGILSLICFVGGFSPKRSQFRQLTPVALKFQAVTDARIISRPLRHVLCMSTEEEEMSSLIQGVGMVAQPVVWISLYFVATTGAGLPAGPFGLLGALEGVSYLVVVGMVVTSLFKDSNTSKSTAERLSYFTLAAGLLTLVALVAQQGCVPNAKPILDYSDYLPVCEATPGLFGE